MGHPPTGNRKYELTHMWERHHEIVRLAVMGLPEVKIASILKCSPQNISDTLNSTIVKDKLAKMRLSRDNMAVDVGDRLRKLAPAAVAKVKEVMEKGDMRTSFAAAKDILDRTGYVAPQRIDVRKMVAHVTSDDIERIKQRQRDKGVLVEGGE